MVQLEKIFEIWDDKGWHYEVGPDRDGLDLIEIRYYESNQATIDRIDRMTFDLETAKLIHRALGELLVDREKDQTN